MTLREMTYQLRLQLVEKGFHTELVPSEERNRILDLKLPKGYEEYRVIYKGIVTVGYLEVWKSDSDTLKVLLFKMKPEFDRVEGTEYISSIVAEYNGATII